MRRVKIYQLEEAIRIEQENTQLASQFYKDLKEKNSAFRPDILLASIIFPLLGAALTFYVLQFVENFHTLIAAFILCLSFGPAFTKVTSAAIEMGIEKPSPGCQTFFNFLLMPAMVIIADSLTIAVVAIITGICTLIVTLIIGGGIFLINGPPFIWPQELPSLITGITAGIFFLFWLSFTISNLDIREIFRQPFIETLSLIPVGISLNISDVLKFFGSVTLGLLIIGAGPLGLIYDSLWQMLLVVGVTGFLMGHSLGRLDDPRITQFINLGLSRTHLALGQTLRARYLAMSVETEAKPPRENFQIVLAQIQRKMLSAKNRKSALREISRLNLISPPDSWELAHSWPDLIKILISLATRTQDKNFSTWLITTTSAVLTVSLILGGGVALGYALHDVEISISQPDFMTWFASFDDIEISQSANDPSIFQLAQSQPAEWSIYIEEINGVPMALVPAGCFKMGSSNEQIEIAIQTCSQEYGSRACKRLRIDAEGPQHEVCFENPYWIDVYEVANSQFEKFGGIANSAGNWKGPEQPREYITWIEAATFCKLRGARLPTEAEWEYAARSPAGANYPWGNEFIPDNLVYKGNADERAWNVGSKPGGMSWVGAYDMSGNVWEWVNDWYSDDYYSTLLDGSINPQGPERGIFRIIKGGSWFSGESVQRSSTRSRLFSFLWANDVGFRCANSYLP